MKNTFIAILGCFILLMGLACSSGAEGDPQVPAVFKVDSVWSAGGSNNIESDMLNSEDGVTADYATVTLSNMQKNTSTGTSTFNDVTIYKYAVEFTRSDGGDVFESFEKNLTATVHVNSTSTISVLLVRLEEKTQGILAGRYDVWPIQLEANITIYGTNGSGQNVTARGGIAVTIADYGDDQGNFVPEVVAFISDKEAVSEGDSLTLSWYLTGYVSQIILNPGNIQLTPDYYPYGNYTIDNAQPGTYTIMALGPYGAATDDLDVGVYASSGQDEPEISYFGIAPEAINSGESAVLEWTVDNADEVTIFPGIGVVASTTGSYVVSPERDTTYTLVAKNDAGSVTETAEVTVASNESITPTIDFFVSNVDEVTLGNVAHLYWGVYGNYTKVELFPYFYGETWDVIDVTDVNSIITSPINVDTTFILAVYSANKVVNASLNISVAEEGKKPVVTVNGFSSNDVSLDYQIGNSSDRNVNYRMNLLTPSGSMFSSESGVLDSNQNTLSYSSLLLKEKGEFIAQNVFYNNSGDLLNDYRYVNSGNYSQLIESVNVVKKNGYYELTVKSNNDGKENYFSLNRLNYSSQPLDESLVAKQMNSNRMIRHTDSALNVFRLTDTGSENTVLVTIEDAEGNKDGRIISFGK